MEESVVDICFDRGEHFIRMFHQMYAEGKTSQNFPLYCASLQEDLDEVRSLTMPYTFRPITQVNLILWFFTVGGDIDAKHGFFSYEEIDAYNDFVIALLADRCLTVKVVAEQVIP